mmetsp:Transcript_30895/g.64754  ORF Transcript_30895/g.64754 Transcript_30895/m.64754 type:complete len:979 (-) Transcript_30895:15-2951(-)
MSESNTIISNSGGANNDASQPPKNNITSFIGGVSLPEYLHDAATSLHRARQDGFDYVVTALPNTLLNKKGNNHSSSDGSNGTIGAVRSATTNVVPNVGMRDPATSSRRRTDVTRLESKWWSTSVVGMVSDPPQWKQSNNAIFVNQQTTEAHNEGSQLLEAITSTGTNTSKEEDANKIFWGMMEWASHMNIPAVILPPVPLKENVGGNDSKRGSNKEGLVPINSDEEEDMFAASSPSKRGRMTPFNRTHPNNKTNDNSKISADVIDINNASAKEYARLLSHLSTSAVCTSSAHVQLWVRVPLSLASLRAFQLLLARCDHSPNVGCMIYIARKIDGAEMPAMVRALHGFIGAGNVRAVSWDTAVFLKNKKGYPTLSKNLQFIFQLLFGRLGRTLRTLVEGRVANPIAQTQGNNASHRLHHLQYLRHLRSSRASLLAKLDSEEAVLETPYLDNLQSPLQPLGDHLEYQTYETFERDPVKYKRYGEAVEYALEDGMNAISDDDTYGYLGSTMASLRGLERMRDAAGGLGGFDLDDDYQHGNNAGDTVEVDIYKVTIMVVGAGRGPLVREAIDAVARVSAAAVNNPGGRRKALHAKIVAIEKNPSAVLYLQSLKHGDPSWNGGLEFDEYADDEGGQNDHMVIPGTSDVTVIGCDMREAVNHPVLQRMIQNPKARADIVVSELLGSFGDNELSPECLDGVQACGILKEGCVSIPQSYTAFIAPVSSARLHSEAKTQACIPLNTNEGPASPPVGLQRAMETPYVVRSHAASQTHDEQPCWTFSHPHPPHASDDNMDTMSDKEDSSDSANAAKNVNNDRHIHLSFHHDPAHGAGIGCGYGALDPEVKSVASASSTIEADATSTIHGFLGSFHSVLYEGRKDNREERREKRLSVISIAPHSFSVGMFSWFPLFFPLKEPLRVPPGATVNCSIWRRSDDGRVWYEWCAEVVTIADHSRETMAGGEASTVVWGTSSIHNPGGRSYHVNK